MAEYALEISPSLFQLATDSLRHHSNSLSSMCSFDDLIEACICCWSKMDAIDSAAIRDHLRTMPTDGAIPLHLTLAGAGSCPLAQVRDCLQTALNCEISWAQTVSALLFLFVVERETGRVFEKVRLGASTTARHGAHSAKIIPFR